MKRLISFLLAVVLICTSLPMYVGAEETTGGYKLDYDRIGEDTYKVYIIADKASLDIHELRVQYGDAEIVSYEWYKQFAEKYEGTVIADDVSAHNYIAFPCAFLSDKNTTEEMEYFGEVVVRITSDSQSIYLLDETGNVIYDELILDTTTEWDGSTPRPIPGEDDQPAPTWNPEWTPVPTAPPTEAPTETPEPTPEPNYETGDVDGNGSINAQDALLVLKYAAKLGDLTDAQFKAANVDDSISVNATDALNILKYAAKIIVRFVFTPDGNLAALKEYIAVEGMSETDGVYVIKKDYVAENDSAYEKEVDSFKYDANSDTLEYRYDISATDDKGSYNYSYFINLGLQNSVIRIVYNEKSEEMNLDFDIQKTIENSTIRFTDDFNVGLVKNKYDVEYLDKKATDYDILQFEQDNVDYINAMMHMAILSMEDYLKNTAVMNLSDLGFNFKYSDEEFEKVFDILYGYDYNITQSIQGLQNLIVSKGIKDGESILIHGADETFEKNQHIGQYYGCEVFLMYGTEVDALIFSGYTYFYDENVDCVVLTNILPMDNRQSYIYVKVYEPNNIGEYVAVAEYETQIDSKDIKFRGEYQFETISEQDSSKNGTFVDLAKQSVRHTLMESSTTWRYDCGYGDVQLPDLGYINVY